MKTLTSLLLGAILALPIVSSMPSRAYALEQKVAVESSQENEDSFIERKFEEVAKALGKRYENLSECEKKQVQENYNSKEKWINFEYRHVIWNVYSEPKKVYESLDDNEKKGLKRFRLQDLSLEDKNKIKKAFPWIKDFKIIDESEKEKP